jgi:hypothetical protein
MRIKVGLMQLKKNALGELTSIAKYWNALIIMTPTFGNKEVSTSSYARR